MNTEANCIMSCMYIDLDVGFRLPVCSAYFSVSGVLVVAASKSILEWIKPNAEADHKVFPTSKTYLTSIMCARF